MLSRTRKLLRKICIFGLVSSLCFGSPNPFVNIGSQVYAKIQHGEAPIAEPSEEPPKPEYTAETSEVETAQTETVPTEPNISNVFYQAFKNEPEISAAYEAVYNCLKAAMGAYDNPSKKNTYADAAEAAAAAARVASEAARAARDDAIAHHQGPATLYAAEAAAQAASDAAYAAYNAAYAARRGINYNDDETYKAVYNALKAAVGVYNNPNEKTYADAAETADAAASDAGYAAKAARDAVEAAQRGINYNNDETYKAVYNALEAAMGAYKNPSEKNTYADVADAAADAAYDAAAAARAAADAASDAADAAAYAAAYAAYVARYGINYKDNEIYQSIYDSLKALVNVYENPNRENISDAEFVMYDSKVKCFITEYADSISNAVEIATTKEINYSGDQQKILYDALKAAVAVFNSPTDENINKAREAAENAHRVYRREARTAVKSAAYAAYAADAAAYYAAQGGINHANNKYCQALYNSLTKAIRAYDNGNTDDIEYSTWIIDNIPPHDDSSMNALFSISDTVYYCYSAVLEALIRTSKSLDLSKLTPVAKLQRHLDVSKNFMADLIDKSDAVEGVDNGIGIKLGDKFLLPVRIDNEALAITDGTNYYPPGTSLYMRMSKAGETDNATYTWHKVWTDGVTDNEALQEMLSGEPEEVKYLFHYYIDVPRILNYDLDGGSWEPDFAPEPFVSNGEKITLPVYGISPPEGKGLDHWEINGVSYAPGAEYTVNDNTTIKAVWKDIFTLTYNLRDDKGNEGTWASEYSPWTEIDTKDPTITLPSKDNVVPPVGFEFDHWEINDEKYDAGAEYTVTGDTTISAFWRQQQQQRFTVSFDLSLTDEEITKSGIIPPHPISVKNGDKVKLPVLRSYSYDDEDKNVHLEFEFAGWSEIKDGDVIIDSEYITVTGNKILYACWFIGEHPLPKRLFYELEDGSWVSRPLTEINANEMINLPTKEQITPPTGYEFEYWEINDEKYAAGAEYTVTDDTTIRAVYRPQQFTVSFDLNGATLILGTPPPSPITALYGEEIVLPIAMLNEGFWAWNINGTEYQGGTKYKVTGDATATAVYSVK